jgi:hypothetical protein
VDHSELDSGVVEQEREHAGPRPAAAPPAVPRVAAPSAHQRVLELQRTAGNRAVRGLVTASSARIRVARWSTPLQGGVPRGTHSTPLADFIEIVRAVEAKFPTSATNTSLMITRLRKLFYGSAGWDAHLIPDAAGVQPVYKVREVETGRRDWGTWPSALEYVDTKTVLDVPDSDGSVLAKLRDPSSVQEVLMPNGDFVDVGHVLAGLDAINHQASVSDPLGLYNISSNVDAVTWVGDLGSILAEVVFQGMKLDRPLNDPEVQAQVDLMAPVQDMLGNVDAYSIAFSMVTAGRKVSDILLDYYGSSSSAEATAAHATRFTTFATSIGLGAFSGGAFANETAWLDKYEVEVGNAAGLYVGAGTHIKAYINPYGVGGLAGLMSGVSTNPFRRPLVEEFLRQLKLRVAAEAGTTAAPATP